MGRIQILAVFISLFFFDRDGYSGNIYQILVGNIEIAIPAKINEINLYHFSGNTAWLQASDSLNWTTISINSQNSWGNLRRLWDAFGVHKNNVNFAGQKHVSLTQTFYGLVQYNMDYLNRVNRAIEIEPYAPDPFVPCDSMEGDFSYIGPKVNVAFSHKLSKNLWWGVGLDYQIYRGLKKIYSLPEIIRREIRLDFSLALRLSPSIIIGVSVRPSDILDIIKIVKQPDGTNPVIFRYRGEFLFTSSTSKDDRNARTEGVEILPQIMIDFARLKGVLNIGYHYQWHEVYDSPLIRKYDGYYQGQNYYFSMIWRYFFSSNMKSGLTFRYHFRYLEDWAEEPVKRLAIYRSFQRYHYFTLGLSRQFGTPHPLILGIESDCNYFLPNKLDYLARVYRKAPISEFNIKLGLAYSPYSRWFVRAAVWYKKFSEPDIWNYFGDYNGVGGSLGVTFNYKRMIWLLTTKFGANTGAANHGFRNFLNVQLQIQKIL